LKKITLQDLPGKEVRIKFNDRYAREFFTEVSRISKIDDMFISLGLKSGNQSVRRYKCNKTSYPLFLVNLFFKEISKINNRLHLSDMEMNVVSIESHDTQGGGKPGKMILNPNLPFILNPSTSRLIAHTLGDGNVNAYGGIRYTNTNKNLISNFINDLKTLGNVDCEITFDSNVYRVHVPKIVKIILDKLGLEDKNYNFILNTTKENQTAFIQALFDDEGSVNLISHRLLISMSNKKLLLAVQKVLENLDIISRIREKNEFF
jgi:hypothetical protein